MRCHVVRENTAHRRSIGVSERATPSEMQGTPAFPYGNSPRFSDKWTGSSARKTRLPTGTDLV